MKSFLFCLLSGLFALTAHAQTCLAIVAFPPGGSSDINVRTLQRFNPDILIDYRPGSFAANAAAFVEQRSDAFFFYNMAAYSNKNPNKDKINFELLQVLFSQELAVVTNKGQSIDDILTGKKTVALSQHGSMVEAVIKQLKQINNNIEIIPTGSDLKSYPLLVNGDVDAAVVGNNVAIQWGLSKKGITTALTIPFNKKIKVKTGTIHHYHYSGIFVSKNATTQQRDHIKQCIRKATSNPQYAEIMKEQNAIVMHNLSEKETSQLFADYMKLAILYDL